MALGSLIAGAIKGGADQTVDIANKVIVSEEKMRELRAKGKQEIARINYQAELDMKELRKRHEYNKDIYGTYGQKREDKRADTADERRYKEGRDDVERRDELTDDEREQRQALERIDRTAEASSKYREPDKSVVQVHDPESPTGSRYVRREDAIGQPGKASRPPATLAPVAPTKGDFTNLEALMSRNPEFAGMQGEDEFKFAVAARARELMKSERLDQYTAMRKALEEYRQLVEPGEKRELFGMDWLKADKPPRFNPDKPIRKYNPKTGRIE